MPKVIYNGKEVEAIDCTPTWEAVVQIHLDCITHHSFNPSAKKGAREELFRMARTADKYNDLAKKYNELFEIYQKYHEKYGEI